MNEQVEALQTLHWVLKTVICTVTCAQSCHHPSRFHLGLDKIKLPCK